MVFPVEIGASLQGGPEPDGAPGPWSRAISDARRTVVQATTVLLSNQFIYASSPAPLEMLSLKLRRPAFSDEIDLNATFDVDTPPARPSGIQHGHAKKLCPEKAQ